MKMPKTMAMKITKENHPIAIALLPPHFAAFSLKEVVGAYVVINELGVTSSFIKPDSKLSVGNSWMPAKEFYKQYFFIYPKKKNQFVEVEDILP